MDKFFIGPKSEKLKCKKSLKWPLFEKYILDVKFFSIFDILFDI